MINNNENNNENSATDIRNKIANLQCSLNSHVSPIGDWKGIKQREFIDLGLTPPYSAEEMLDYHQKRQAVRDEINSLQAQLEVEENGESNN